ncbi:MAG: Hsp70 family protein [Deltaproteobacteria bacterium]|jgi:hypothetical protein|nr:Hsp70 family protein [Deltaproteobacteria bacterium]
MTAVLGIDLGTVRSRAAVAENSGPGEPPHIVKAFSITSAVWADGDGGLVTGDRALRLAESSPENLVESAMRLAGWTFGSPWIREYASRSRNRVTEGPGGFAAVEARGRVISPIEILAAILERLRDDAERYYGAGITRTVIAVPALFGVLRRRAVRDAALVAGMNDVSLANSPLCAAVACGPGGTGRRAVLVCDLGAGFLEVGAVWADGGRLDVLGYGGDPFMGSEDMGFAHGGPGAGGGVEAAAAEAMAGAVRRAIVSAGALAGRADRVILLGGVLKAPDVPAPVRGIFGDRAFVLDGPAGAVASGAALSAFRDPDSLRDVIPFSLGIETDGGGYSEIVPRNEAAAETRFGFFTPANGGETQVAVKVMQGPGGPGAPSLPLGSCVVRDLAPRPVGETLVRVSFAFTGQEPGGVWAGDTRGEENFFRLRPGAGFAEEELLCLALEREIARVGKGRGGPVGNRAGGAPAAGSGRAPASGGRASSAGPGSTPGGGDDGSPSGISGRTDADASGAPAAGGVPESLGPAARELARAVGRVRAAVDPELHREAWEEAYRLALAFQEAVDLASAGLGPAGVGIGALGARLWAMVLLEPAVPAPPEGDRAGGLVEFRFGLQG